MKINQKQSGFTLIELVMVIVILGILAATALPKFVDLKQDAETAAMKGVAGAVSSAFAVNYAGFAAGGSARAVQLSAAAQDFGAAVGSVLVGGLPAGYLVTPTGTVNCGTGGATAGVTISASAHGTDANSSAVATLVCTG